MSEQAWTNCPQCPRHCPLNAVSCERGEALLLRIQAGEAMPQEEAFRGRGHHGPHGREKPDLESLEGLLRACGHRLHHGGSASFSALTEEEQQGLKALLKKLVASWE